MSDGAWCWQMTYTEHALHARHPPDIPRTDVLVEGSRIVEHEVHVHHLPDIPVCDHLVEGRRAIEHAVHGRHRAGVGPVEGGAAIGEGGGLEEHEVHGGHRTRVPRADVLIEGKRTGEQERHDRHVPDIPTPDVPVEGPGILQHSEDGWPCGVSVDIKSRDGRRRS